MLNCNKQYYEVHKEHINEKASCNICGCQTIERGIARHQTSKKCKLIATNLNKQI